MTAERTIAVIGASRGIGRSVVRLLADDENNRILAFSRDLNKMNEEFITFSNVSCFPLDLDSLEVRKNMTALLNDTERIDAVINMAGYLVNRKFSELSHEDIRKSYQVNVIGIMEAVQSIIERMKEGHIVNISSMGGFQGSVKFPGLVAYSTSKAALCSFTELFAEEHKESGIKMNCLCLGAVQTEMLEEAFPGYAAPLGPDKMAEFIVDFTLKGHQWMNGKIIPVSLSTP